jgi:hypothetical protein
LKHVKGNMILWGIPPLRQAAGQMIINSDITRVVPIATLFAQYSLCADEAAGWEPLILVMFGMHQSEPFCLGPNLNQTTGG